MFWFILILIGCGWYYISKYINKYLEEKGNIERNSEIDEMNDRISLAQNMLPKLKQYRLNLKADINEIKKLLANADREKYMLYLSQQENLEEREKLISALIKCVEELSEFKILSHEVGETTLRLWKASAGSAYYTIYNETGVRLEEVQQLLNSW